MGTSSVVEAGHFGPQPSGTALNHNVPAPQRSSLLRDGQTQSEDWTTISTHRKNKSKEVMWSPDSPIITMGRFDCQNGFGALRISNDPPLAHEMVP